MIRGRSPASGAERRASARRAPAARSLGPALVLLLTACGARPGGAPPAEGASELAHLEHLAFVPAARCRLTSRWFTMVDCSNEQPLLVGRYEVTRAEWAQWLATLPAAERPPAIPAEVVLEPSVARLPASFMTAHEASAFAAWRGMRLLTAREWLRVAAGTRGRRWPWGDFAKSTAANTLELALEGPTPVGAFEHGRTPLAIYDLLGNVAEWVEGEWQSSPAAVEFVPQSSPGESTWAMGGSYLTRARRSVVAGDRENAQLLHRAHRAADVGLRLAADAREYLSSRAALLEPLGAAEARRLRALGRQWGTEAAAFLAELARGTDGAGRAALAALAAGAAGE